MWSKALFRCSSLALAFAIAACTITTSSDTCSPDSTVDGCAQGSSGYSCTGSATPAQSTPSLNCSAGVPGNAGSTLFCCASGATGTTCAPDTTVSGCAGTSQGYSCTGSDSPPQGYPSLSCGAGTPGNAGSTLYCCTGGGADGGGACAPDPAVSGCTSPATGYACTGSNAPPQTNSSLTCGPGAPGDAGSTVYCCTSSATGADGSSDVGAEGGGDATVDAVGDAAAEADSDAVSDSGNDVLVDGGSETSVDAGTCSVSVNTGSPTCDQCMQSLCCTAIVSCDTADDAGVDDGGNTACESLLNYTLGCVAGDPEAGVEGGSVSACESAYSPNYTLAEQQNASAVLQCQTTSCSQQCQ